jgi:hypothetical protein
MTDEYRRITELVDNSFSTARRPRNGRADCLEDRARAELRRFLDTGGFGWTRRQELRREAEAEIAARRRAYDKTGR